MLQLKVPVEGRDAGGPQGTYWMSPQRDIAINYPVLVEKALAFATEIKTDPRVLAFYEAHPDGEDLLTELAKQLIAFVHQTTQVPDIKVNEAYEASGLKNAHKDTYDLFCYAFTLVTFSAYFHAAREASRGTFNPFILSDLRSIVKNG